MNNIITKEDIKDTIPSFCPYEVLDDYCSEDILQLLKDLGVIHIFEKGYQYGKSPFITHQIVMKWLRDKGIIISVEPHYQYAKPKYGYHLWHLVHGYKVIYRDCRETLYNTYKEVIEAALKYCLTNLI